MCSLKSIFFKLGDLWSSSNGPTVSAGNPFAMPAAPAKANPFQMPTVENIDEEGTHANGNITDLSNRLANDLAIQEEEEEEEEEEQEELEEEDEENDINSKFHPSSTKVIAKKLISYVHR